MERYYRGFKEVEIIRTGLQTNAMVRTLFPDGNGIFQDDNALIHTTHEIKNWYEEH